MPTETLDSTALTFIRHCLESRWEPAALDRAASLAGTPAFDWDLMLDASYRSRTTGLLHDALQDQPWVPDPVAARLRQVYLHAAVRHLRATHVYARLLQAFNGAGIDHIVFKGPVLAELVYQNPALRTYTDLDILIHREDLQATKAVLTQQGYSQRFAELRPGSREATGSEDAWGKSEGSLEVHIDLHWKPVGKIYGEMAWMWSHTQPWAMQDASTRVFEPEVRLLYLAAHLALHHGQVARGDVLYLLYDVALIVRSTDPALDWAHLLDLARAHRLAAPLQAALRMTDNIWPLELQDWVMDELARTHTSREDVQAVALFTAEAKGRLDQLGGFWFALGKYATRRERIRTLQSHIFPAWDYMAHRYRTRGPVHTALSYPYRWGYGLVSLLQTVGRILRRRR
jgi:hypothetical protein